MERITIEQEMALTPRYYIPHHAVLKGSSLTTKLRVVFDASCKSSTGISLNECLSVGPTCKKICSRSYYAFVPSNESQTPLQTILWRTDSSEKMAAFELKTVTYGTASFLPFIAVRAMQELANTYASTYPVGANTEQEIRVLRNETIKILNSGGFHLRKWASNCPKLLEDVPHADICEPIHFINTNEEVSTLGMLWNTKTDDLQYHIDPSDHTRITKRSMLSRVWQLDLAWDETVPMSLHTAWTRFASQLSAVGELKVPRYVACKNAVSIQIHGFSDASEKAYGACVYLRVAGPQGQISTRLLCSRSRVAPLKAITLLRLELCGAVLLAQLMDKVLRAVRFEPEAIYCWTDSTIVIHWIRATDKNWNVFVTNRVSEIHRLSQASSWFHVATECNPADYVSRGSLPSILIDAVLWWSGPPWLEREIQNWCT
ncbi:PREDICTED: uncharacterized protein LOC108760103, partial [Trachymyrmex cornetzi]|uniref:uncharacterized protein LOC108760103 n=1 Tax=Trachymyrmex cornetzi TaxID=471704 RepID=UPI00084F1C23